jgi:ATP-dependent DNA helicase RecQ
VLSHIEHTLYHTFGLDRLRNSQEAVIRSVLERRNTLAIMPTGAGKSLCYQLPALHLPGTTIIVSPLISLMKDQVDKLREVGLSASQVNSALSEREHEETIERIQYEQSEFIFTTPSGSLIPHSWRRCAATLSIYSLSMRHTVSPSGGMTSVPRIWS